MRTKLREITEDKIGFKISNLSDSKRLSEIILIKLDRYLNYNTVRRFFGLVKSVKASNYTLDTFAKFNEYENYNDFVINFERSNKWKTEFQIIEVIHANKDTELLNYITEKIHLEKYFYLKFIQILRELILIQNYKLLIKIFRLKETQEKYFTFDDILLIGISVGKLLKLIDYEKKEIHKLLLLENFQDLIITINVDYGNLSNYYKYAITTIYQNSKRKKILEFCKGVLNVYLYLQNNTEQQFYALNYDENFHPILKSRVYAQYILMEDSNIIKKLNNYYHANKNKNQVSVDHFFEIIFSSILTKNFEVMAWVINKVSNQRDYKYFYKFEHYQNFLFMKLLFYLKNNDLLNIKNTLLYFSFKNFNRSYRGVIDQYIYIFKYHMNPLEKNEYLKLYLKNSKLNKFHFFTREYFLNYFISNGH